MKIGHIDLDRETFVIAEVGNNHEGDHGRAEEMVWRAAEAGAHAVKFQTVVPDRYVRPQETARVAQLRRITLPLDSFPKLAETARRAGILFLSTPFDVDSVSVLEPDVPAFKVASGDNNFVPLLRRVAETGKPVLLSLGMADLADLNFAHGLLERTWREQGATGAGLIPLHCVAAYPVAPEFANLRAIRTIADATGLTVGYSDHTVGLDAPLLAVALGARVIEKHFTLSRSISDFRDHQLSLEPSEMAELVRRIKETAAMLGDGAFAVSEAERATAAVARRSICARRDLPAGHVVSPADIDWLRPSGGLAPGNEAQVLGRRLSKPVAAGEWIMPDAVVE
ncbi:MAG TPA: N-acetylneuraminate synthase family protein [Azospirillaceae bacterium]|nr:N-acetylneuraminate synthase family protein [Azospirillaceae bacterium]